MRGALPHPSPHPSTPITRRAFGAPVGEGSIQWPTREEQRGLRSPSPKCERAWGVETTRQGLAWLREPAAERADAGWPVTGRSLQRHTQWVARRPGGPKLSCPFSPNRLCPLAAAQESCSCDVPKRNPASPTGGRARRGPRALRSAVTTRPPRQLAWPLRVPGAGSPPAPPGRAERLQVLLPHLRRASPARGTCPSEPGVRGCTNPHALSHGTAHLRGEARLRFSMLRSPLPNAP